ncbi:oocyte zinc finger protein XlCOF20-like, partial [Chiloscyllium plagiosum]|uniref:oocyte zinc finger protein XlCOF20-like n=1 Tax=Chiloscyllium plagiosum TaxID=36176 RepID=UPI001CB884AB
MERWFSCFLCGQRFIDASHVLKHQRVHLGERPFTCSECRKGFVDSYTLLTHQQVHIGEAVHMLCVREGVHSDIYNVIYQWVHLMERALICSHCGKCFTRSSHLQSHQRVLEFFED